MRPNALVARCVAIPYKPGIGTLLARSIYAAENPNGALASRRQTNAERLTEFACAEIGFDHSASGVSLQERVTHLFVLLSVLLADFKVSAVG